MHFSFSSSFGDFFFMQFLSRNFFFSFFFCIWTFPTRLMIGSTNISISSGQRNLMKTYHNEANTGGITKIALKNFLDFFRQRRLSYKIANFWLSKSFFYVKNCLNLSKKIFIEEYQFRLTFFVKSIFCWLQFLNHFITKMRPNFWRTVTWRRPKIW